MAGHIPPTLPPRSRAAGTPSRDPGSTVGSWFLARANLQVLIDHLRAGGRVVLGPTVRDGVIVLDEIRSTDELPRGWRDEQAAGTYRLRRDDDDPRQFGLPSARAG
jgi:hypothetical protein